MFSKNNSISCILNTRPTFNLPQMLYAFQLGRLPMLGLAELRARFREADTLAESNQLIVLDLDMIADPQKMLDQFGGIIRIIEIQRIQKNNVLPALREIVEKEAEVATKKLSFGISQFGTSLQARRFGLDLKKQLRQAGRSVRFVDAKGKVIATASVLHNRLTELVTIELKGQLFIGHTVAIQNIDEYTRRDTEKPVRDMKRGMLPPKLAQVMLSIAKIPEGGSVLDPFCGIGTIPMEAMLRGLEAYGSDNDPDAITGSRLNCEWLTNTYQLTTQSTLQICDADELPKYWHQQFDAIVTEGSLGPMLEGLPTEEEAHTIHDNLLRMYKGFFAAAAVIVKPGGSLIITVPFFRLTHKKIIIDRSAFLAKASPAWRAVNILPEKEAIPYERPDQFVGREIWKFRKSS